MVITIFFHLHGIYCAETNFGVIFGPFWTENTKNAFRKNLNDSKGVPNDPKSVFEHWEIIFFKISQIKKFHVSTPKTASAESKITKASRAWKALALSHTHMNHMVRSTLLHLPPRGALRAKLGGPLVRLFFVFNPMFS